MPDSSRSLLEVEGLVSGYGKKQVLNGVSIEVMEGEIMALIGHNGAGKSTLLKTVFGLLPAWKGQMTLDGKGLTSLPHANCWA